ncbi:hypothetical protein CRG98_011028 [Punica granatum]|uniref:Uncharacterized protein n=1 Tax=Punica granatum TaxID=22663 RepID=A0A2I0KJ44_PUNGR|nr:hypothetical protein CRG98_011028 [Punica granatum]
MQHSDQDQRSLGIEDTSITVEFLRARLLAERSVSKSARQRADELAERVAELEEQLRIVSLQRKKAEKATVDVLAILEAHGMSDMSDSFYWSSDQEETPRGQKVRGSGSKKAEGSVNSIERSEPEKFSASELEPSSMPGRSLSWKGRRDPSRSVEKSKDSPIRRRSSFASASSSSKHRLGKSCRQIKRREQRLEAAKFGDDSSAKADSQNDGGESEAGMETSRVDSGLQEQNESLEAAVLSHSGDEFGAEREMERALEHQAQLIGQYKDMEKAQREWEEKYRENNSSTAESCDPGNHSDITDEREEMKSQSPYSHQSVTIRPEDSTLKLPSTCNGFSETHASHEFVETSRGDKKADFQVQEGPISSPPCDPMEQKSSALASDGPSKQETPEKILAQGSETSGKQMEPHALVPHQTSDRVGSLLDTLQQAKSLLQKEITQVPPVGFGGAGKAIEPSFRDPGPTYKANIPRGCPGLFRLPTDFMPEPTRGNFPFFSSSSGLSSRSSLTGYFPDNRALLGSDDRFAVGRCIDSRPMSLSLDDRFLSNQFMDFASRTIPPNPRLDPQLNSVAPTSYTSYPQYPSYPNLVPRQPSNGGYFPRLDSNMASAVPPSDDFHFRGDISGSKMMYR